PMSRRKEKGRLPPFVPIYRHTVSTKAYEALSVGARCVLFELSRTHNSKAENAVFLSARAGAKRLGACKDTVCKWQRELEHYGFIAVVRGAHLGVEGVGKATLYRLTDRAYAGQPATREFEAWDGVLFDPKKQNPVRKTRTPCPKRSDIRANGKTPLNGNNRPISSDIRNDMDCHSPGFNGADAVDETSPN